MTLAEEVASVERLNEDLRAQNKRLRPLAEGAQAAQETITLLRGDIETMQKEKDRQFKTIQGFLRYMWNGKPCSEEIFNILGKQERAINELNDALSKSDLVTTTQMLNGQQDLIDDLKAHTEAQRKTIVEYQRRMIQINERSRSNWTVPT